MPKKHQTHANQPFSYLLSFICRLAQLVHSLPFLSKSTRRSIFPPWPYGQAVATWAAISGSHVLDMSRDAVKGTLAFVEHEYKLHQGTMARWVFLVVTFVYAAHVSPRGVSCMGLQLVGKSL